MRDQNNRVMRASAKRLRMPVTRTLGLRKPIGPRASPDLRIFRVMQKISLRVAGEYIKKLLDTA
jgi:hypothetical protein